MYPKEGKKNGDGKGRRRVEERATAKEGGENHDGDKARRRAGHAQLGLPSVFLEKQK